jgi:hypothetical protein
MKERQKNDAQHTEAEKKQLVWIIKKDLKNYALRSLSDEAFLHYIGREETEQGGESQADGRKKAKTTGLTHKVFHRTYVYLCTWHGLLEIIFFVL